MISGTNMATKLYYKGNQATSMDVMEGDIDYWKTQGWLPQAGSQIPVAPVAQPAPVTQAPATPTQSVATTQPIDTQAPTQAKPPLTPQPVQPGEREALVNKYLSGGYSLQEATSRVNELFSQRPEAPVGTPRPTEMEFAPTKEKLPTVVTKPTPAPKQVEPEIVTPEMDFTNTVNQLLERYGVSPVDATKSPINQALEAYKTVYQELGLPDVKARFDEVQKEYAAQQQELADKISDVNENPWITEGVRRAKVSALQSRYELKGAVLSQQMGLYQDIFESGQRQADFVLNQVAQTQQAQDQMRNELVMRAIQQAEEMMTPKYTPDIQEYLFAKSQGYRGDYIDFQQDLKAASEVATPKIRSQVVEIGGEKLLVDLDTGETISNLGTATSNDKAEASKMLSSQALDVAELLEVHPGFSGAVGFRFGQALIPGTAAAGFNVQLDRLKSLLTLPQLTYLKGLGHMSDREFASISSSVAALSTKMSEKEFTTELNRIKQTLKDVIGRSESSATSTIEDEANNLSKELGIPINEINEALKEYLPSQIREFYSPKDSGSVSLRVTLPDGTVKEGGTASWRNNNPLNIKYGNFALDYGALKGSAATDGGNFAAFPSEQDGLRAARDLLRSKNYKNLSLEAAMKRWSGQGYGADVAPVSLRNKTTGQMTDQELNILIQSMKKREGYKSGRIIV